MTSRLLLVAALAALALPPASAQDRSGMTFFVTSRNPGQGANLGGLEGADRHCQTLAAAAGAGARTWRAYLSTQPTGGQPAVNARDRIGRGPWQNATGVVIARNVEELHGDNNNLNKSTALTESGQQVPGRGDQPASTHDMLTGSTPEGRAFPAGEDMTCRNWTSSEAGGAMVGHHDRTGTPPDPARAASWNSSHTTPGCSTEALRRVGGGGLFYCFAAN